MVALSIASIIGIFGFIFRLWLVEIELRQELGYRRRYLSRFVNYYFFLALIFNFTVMVFNLITVTVIPFVIIAMLSWDRKWFLRYKNYSVTKRKKFWLVIERITLHTPILIVGLIPYFTGISAFILAGIPSMFDINAILSLIVAALIIFIPFILFDERIVKRHKWPTGKYMLIGMFVMMSIMYAYLFLAEIFGKTF